MLIAIADALLSLMRATDSCSVATLESAAAYCKTDRVSVVVPVDCDSLSSESALSNALWTSAVKLAVTAPTAATPATAILDSDFEISFAVFADRLDILSIA
jgi:hypothetical protein